MEIKGNIEEEVLVKAVIKKIWITGEGTKYYVQLKGRDEIQEVDDTVIKFNEPCKEVRGFIEEPLQEIKKKRGRPKKATVESLMKKSEAIKRGE